MCDGSAKRGRRLTLSAKGAWPRPLLGVSETWYMPSGGSGAVVAPPLSPFPLVLVMWWPFKPLRPLRLTEPFSVSKPPWRSGLKF